MDFLSLEADKSGTKDILVITDDFTKFVVAIPTPNQAKCLWENYGILEKLHSDTGPDFERFSFDNQGTLSGGWCPQGEDNPIPL